MSHSSFWLDSGIQKSLTDHYLQTPEGMHSPEFAMQMAAIRRAVANFCHIVTQTDIKVEFSSGTQSYSTKEDRIVISAVSDPRKLDAMVGVALHEAVHLILTKRTKFKESIPWFSMIEYCMEHMSMLFTDSMIDNATRLGHGPELFDDLRLVLNVLEDRRIDKWFYQRAIGYRPYYDAMYDEHWHSPDIDAALLHPQYHTPTLFNYKLHFVNMTNPNASPEAIPGLREIWSLVDLPHIERFADDPRWDTWQHTRKLGISHKWDDLPDMLSTALRILNIMYQNSEVAAPEQSPSPTPTTPQPSELPNLDQAHTNATSPFDAAAPTEPAENDVLRSQEPTTGTPTDQKVRDAFNKQLNTLNGMPERQKLDTDVLYRVDAMESSGARMTQVGDGLGVKIPIIVYHKLTQQLLESPSFYHTVKHRHHAQINPTSVRAIAEGTRMGAILAHRLRVLADESTIKYTREKQGRLDTSLLASLGYDNEDVFERTAMERLDPVSVHLSLDASTSMEDGGKWRKALALAVALAKTAEKVRTLRLVVSMRAGGGREGFGYVTILYDSKVDRFVKTQMFQYLRPSGGTPEGLSFEAIQAYLLDTSRGTRKFFVNISDGVPFFRYKTDPQQRKDAVKFTERLYSGQSAWAHTARQVQAMRNAGITVVSYFIHASSAAALDKGMGEESNTGPRIAFTRMYGRNAQFIEPANITDVARTLNLMFLSKPDR